MHPLQAAMETELTISYDRYYCPSVVTMYMICSICNGLCEK
jgi:hypothetical protein